MASRESIIAEAVAKNLKKYLDVQRREQGFDLSHLSNPTTENWSKNKLHQESKLKNVDLDNLTKSTLLQHQICKLSYTKHLSERERQVKLNIQKEMARHISPNVVSPYIQPVVNPSQIRNDFEKRDEFMKKKKKKRVLSAWRLGRGGYRTIRSAPSQRVSSAERDRIINMTTKLLVATEGIALPQNRKQSRSSQTSSEENFPVIPAVQKVQQMRPRPAFSESDPANLEKNKRSPERNHSAKSSTHSEHPVRKVDHDIQIERFDDKFIITRKTIEFPSSIFSSRSRPKSAVARSKKGKKIDFANSSEEEVEDSPENTPLKIPKRAWVDSSSNASLDREGVQEKSGVDATSDDPSSECSSREDKGLQVRSGEDLLAIKSQLYPKEKEMSTQTMSKDFPPKVVTYEVYVVTGNKLGAETKAKVKINIFGENGNTGDRPLIKSKVHNISFQRNQVDVFHLDCLFLGKLSSVRIGHDGTSADDGWYLEKILISFSQDSNVHEFSCKKWLSAREGDGQIIRDVLLSGLMSSSRLPSVLSRSSIDAKRPSVEDSRAKSKVSNKNKTNENLSSGSSTKSNPRKTRRSSNSFVSSSDSENEKEQRQQEKLKRREKRQSREIPPDKPKANVGGIINKVGICSRDNAATSQHKLQNGKSHKQNLQPSVKTDVENPSASNPPSFEKHESVALPSHQLTSKQSLQVPGPLPGASSIASVSSISSSSSTDSSDDDSKKKEMSVQKNTENKENEDKVEFSNKNTIKKCLESNQGSIDDLYMAGFLAGIKASKERENEEEKEAKKKQEFEEKLKNGPTIHQACETGDLDRLKELVSLVSDLKNKADERGWAPVHISAAFGHLDLLKWLSVSDVDLTQQTPTGYKAIHLAAMNGHVNCIMILAAMGCPISCRTVDQFTPLHLATMSGHIECVKWLLSNRAKIDVKDVTGRTPLSLAEDYKHDECIKLLKIMKRELSQKGSAMAMLRDPLALRYNVDPNEFLMQMRGADSGVGENEDEEWVSDTEGTSDVVGRGGDDRPESVRRISVQVGRKESAARKGSRLSSGLSSGKGRRLSKQEIRQSNQLEEKKKIYQQQIQKQSVRKTSFLDSIRAEIDDNKMDNTV